MSEDFAQLRDSILRTFPGSDLVPVTYQELTAIREQLPNVPEHYLSFLRQVGWGGLGDGNFMIYAGPIKPSEIFDPETAAVLDGVLFFGDDFAGWSAGFDTREGWQIVGVSSVSLEPYPEGSRTVADFVAKRVSHAKPD